MPKKFSLAGPLSRFMDEDEEDFEIPKKFELLELGKRLEITAPIFTEEEVAEIMKSVLKGLQPVHEMDHIHRDVKPENIILAPAKGEKWELSSCQSDLKLIDFGFSAKYRLQRWEQLEGNVGTTLFMAPE